MSLVLAVDPGLDHTGHVVTLDGKPVLAFCGVWTFGPATGTEEQRQYAYALALRRLITDSAANGCDLYGKAVLAVERQFLRANAPNAKSVLSVAVMHGLFAGVCACCSVPTAPQVTQQQGARALTGNGKADDDQRLEAAGRLLGRTLAKGEIHLADALGFALAVEARENLAANVKRVTIGARAESAQIQEARGHKKTASQAYAEQFPAKREGVKQRVIG